MSRYERFALRNIKTVFFKIRYKKFPISWCYSQTPLIILGEVTALQTPEPTPWRPYGLIFT